MFISRAELLPEDETVAEHQAAKDEEVALVKIDVDGQGLFNGAFKTVPLNGGLNGEERLQFYGALQDVGDGVMRCPQCMWELAHGVCEQCNWRPEDFSEPDVSDTEEHSDLDQELDDEVDYDFDDLTRRREVTPYADTDVGTEYTVNSDHDSAGHEPVGRPSISISISEDESEEESSSEDDGDDESMQGFVVDDEGDGDQENDTEQESESGSDAPVQRGNHQHFHGIELDYDDSPDEDDSGDESSDTTPMPEVQPVHNRRRNRVIQDDEDDEEDNEEEVRSQQPRMNEAVVDLTRSSPQSGWPDLDSDSDSPPRSWAERNNRLNIRRSTRGRRDELANVAASDRSRSSYASSTTEVTEAVASAHRRSRAAYISSQMPRRRDPGQSRVSVVMG